MKRYTTKSSLFLAAVLIIQIGVFAYFRIVTVNASFDPNAPDANAASVQNAIGALSNVTLPRNSLIYAQFFLDGADTPHMCGLYVFTKVMGSPRVRETIVWDCSTPSQAVCDANNDGVDQIEGCPAFSPPARPSASATFDGCNGATARFVVTWWPNSTGGPASGFDVEYRTGSTWYDYYQGGPMCVPFNTDADTHFRVKAENSAGYSPWKYFNANHSCDDVGGGGFAW